ncbi:MAG: septum formation protein Maf [Candidatus Omnitrophica bacterium]|nr:septum formation protein Maf [Candidatus Omnitrophota bacterium]
MKVILASQSKRRAEILRAHGYRIRVIPARGVCERDTFKRPSALVMHNAMEKARAVAADLSSGIVIGADTIIYFKGRIIGKPRTRKDAFATVKVLQNDHHTVYTGVSICDAGSERMRVFYEKTIVTFKKLNDRAISAYLSYIDPMDKAGAYAIQEHGEMVIKNIKGSIANVIGFPIEAFKREWARFCRNRSTQ